MEDERGNYNLEREKGRAECEIESRKNKKQTNELERELEVCRNKCNELSVELQEKKMECVGFEGKLEELAQYKMMYNGLKHQINCLEEDRRVVRQSENKAQEWIAYLSEEMRKMENRDTLKIRDLESEKRSVEDENEGLKKTFKELGIEFSRQKHGVQVERGDREKYAELEIKIRDLECGKKIVEGENESLKRRVTELGIEFSRHKHEVQVEKVELEVRRKMYSELSVQLETKKMECNAIGDKFEALMVRKIAVEDELKECKTVCNGLKEKITCIEKDQNILCGKETKAQETIAQLLEELKKKEPEECRRKIAEEETEIWKKKCNTYKITCKRLKEKISEGEKMAQRRITNLSEELKKMERDEKEMYDQLEAENQDLESAKRRAEAETVDWNKRFKELETQAAVRAKHEVELEKELDVYRNKCDVLSREFKKMERDGKEKYDQLKSENQDLEFEKRRGEDDTDIWKKWFCELESRVLRETTVICRESNASGVIESDPGGLTTEVYHNVEKDDRNKTIKLQSEVYGGDINGALVVHVTDGAIDMQCLPVKNVEKDFEFGKQLVLELEGTNEMQSVLELGSIRPASGQIIDISDYSSDNSLIKEIDLAPKKCLKRLYSDQSGEIYGGRCNKDSPFTSSPKRKRASESPNASCGGLNVEQKNGWAEKTSPNEHTSLTQLDLSGKSNEKVGNQIAEKGKEKMEQKVGSDIEDEILGGFKLEGSDSSDSGYSSSDSEVSVNLQLAFDNASKLFFSRDNQPNSKIEVDKGAHKLQHFR